MKQLGWILPALAGIVINVSGATNHAARVISYHPGTNHADGFTNSAAVLGEPSRVNPFDDATEPFNPPYGRDQVLSIGKGGHVTIKFRRPVFNALRRPFGLDFIVFGNSGFIITNEFDLETFDWIGTPATDGSLFGHNTGVTRVSVSANGRRFFALDPEQAPAIDVLFPTDGQGSFRIPVNPELTQEDFAGAAREDIRHLYDSSAGGAGFNIAWARTKNGRRFPLRFIRFVRVEVLQGKAEIDGFAATARTARNRQR